MKLFAKIAAAVAVVAAPVAAFATPPAFDVSDAVDTITGGNTAIAALGLAALGLVIGLKVWKRLRGAG